MKPKKYAIAVYANTRTLSLLEKSQRAVLQALSPDNINLVKYLGFKSAHHYNKMAYLKKKKVLIAWKDYVVLNNAAAWIELEKESSINVGDHQLFIMQVIAHQSNHEHILLTSDLRSQGIIR
jgi:Conserved protein/domain typically associated with flavoprotein oxygenases, DIM6/NTAB family